MQLRFPEGIPNLDALKAHTSRGTTVYGTCPSRLTSMLCQTDCMHGWSHIVQVGCWQCGCANDHACMSVCLLEQTGF